MDSLQILRERALQFGAERDWQQFHSPKNLAMALAGEAGELLECFQWLTEEASGNLDAEQHQAVKEEIADIQLYLVLLADKLNIDIYAAADEKIAKNTARYPVDRVKGSSKKYNQY